MTMLEHCVSRRIASLQRKLEAGNTEALDAFWQEVATQGVPLIETIDGDDRHMLVTFLWRASEVLNNVTVVGGLAGYGFAGNQMTPLLDTDLWFKSYRARVDTRTTYWLSPNDSLVAAAEVEDWAARSASWQHDPLNPHTYVWPRDVEDPNDQDLVWSVLELPAAPPQPWSRPQPGTPRGRLEMYRLRSEILRNERRVWIYTPPGYTPSGDPYDLLLLFDGLAYIDPIPTPTILDNLLADGRLRPLVAVILDTLDHKTRTRELNCYPPFIDFLTHECLPWLQKQYHITSDPQRTTVGGSSSGGLASAFAALCHPELFGNVLSQSGFFAWAPDIFQPADDSEHEWLIRQFATSPRLPLRFYLDVGLLEVGQTFKNDPPSPRVSNRHMRTVLQAKGYPVHYAEFSGGHDYLCWRGTLTDGLLALLERM